MSLPALLSGRKEEYDKPICTYTNAAYLEVSDADVHNPEGKAHGVTLEARGGLRCHIQRHCCIQQLQGDQLPTLHYDFEVNSHHPQVEL